MSNQDLVPTTGYALSPAEYALLEGDLSKLNEGDRLQLYNSVCNSLGLNPMTAPFGYIRLSNKLTLYAKKDCTDQLRKLHGVSIIDLVSRDLQGAYIVTARAQDRNGRIDVATGAVPIGKDMFGENLCNALMKAETKAKRRVTLSICGLGMLDESETGSIAGAEIVPHSPISKEPTDTELFDRCKAKRDDILKPGEKANIWEVIAALAGCDAEEARTNDRSRRAAFLDALKCTAEQWETTVDATVRRVVQVEKTEPTEAEAEATRLAMQR